MIIHNNILETVVCSYSPLFHLFNLVAQFDKLLKPENPDAFGSV